MDEAKHAVGNIKPEALSEIRSLRMPPDVIRDILEGVLRLMGIFDTSWVSMKRSDGKDTEVYKSVMGQIPRQIKE